jgi:hypothetical protein
MEVLMSPIGLMMVVINFSPPAVRRPLREADWGGGKVVFEYTEASQVWGDFYGTSHLSYRIRPRPRPP